MRSPFTRPRNCISEAHEGRRQREWIHGEPLAARLTFFPSLERYLYLHYKKYDKTKYGIFLFKEKESWVIGNIDKEIDSTVIGKKIVSINNIPINEIEQKIIAFESGENEYWKYLQFLSNCIFPSYWEAIGVVTPPPHPFPFVVVHQKEVSKFNMQNKKTEKLKR